MVFWSRKKKAKKDLKKVGFDDSTLPSKQVAGEKDRPSPKRWKSQLIGFNDHPTQPTRQKTMSMVLEKNEEGLIPKIQTVENSLPINMSTYWKMFDDYYYNQIQKFSFNDYENTLDLGMMYVKVIRAFGLPKMDKFGKCDAYVMLKLVTNNVTWRENTHTVKNDLNPEFGDEFFFDLPNCTGYLELSVWDHDKCSKDDLIAQVELPLKFLVSQPSADYTIKLPTKEKKKCDASIVVRIHFQGKEPALFGQVLSHCDSLYTKPDQTFSVKDFYRGFMDFFNHSWFVWVGVEHLVKLLLWHDIKRSCIFTGYCVLLYLFPWLLPTSINCIFIGYIVRTKLQPEWNSGPLSKRLPIMKVVENELSALHIMKHTDNDDPDDLRGSIAFIVNRAMKNHHLSWILNTAQAWFLYTNMWIHFVYELYSFQRPLVTETLFVVHICVMKYCVMNQFWLGYFFVFIGLVGFFSPPLQLLIWNALACVRYLFKQPSCEHIDKTVVLKDLEREKIEFRMRELEQNAEETTI